MRDRPAGNYKGVDDYIAYQDPALQPMLKKIRSVIQAAVPNAEEVISYMIPCYKQQGMLVGFGAHKNGCSFYIMNPKMLATIANDLKGYKYTGSTIHFDHKKALPVALIKKLIRMRIKENKERADLKAISKSKK